MGKQQANAEERTGLLSLRDTFIDPMIPDKLNGLSIQTMSYKTT
jgi:hypothetical protein